MQGRLPAPLTRPLRRHMPPVKHQNSPRPPWLVTLPARRRVTCHHPRRAARLPRARSKGNQDRRGCRSEPHEPNPRSDIAPSRTSRARVLRKMPPPDHHPQGVGSNFSRLRRPSPPDLISTTPARRRPPADALGLFGQPAGFTGWCIRTRHVTSRSPTPRSSAPENSTNTEHVAELPSAETGPGRPSQRSGTRRPGIGPFSTGPLGVSRERDAPPRRPGPRLMPFTSSRVTFLTAVPERTCPS